MRQPASEMLLSLAMRQRNLNVRIPTEAGKFTVVVIKPFELPVHAIRPAMGLPDKVEIVPL